MKKYRDLLLAIAVIGAFASPAVAALQVLTTPAQLEACKNAGGKVVVQSDGKTKVCVMPPPEPGTMAPH